MRTSRRQAFILALSLTACLLALTAPHRARASTYNYITNGGFESGDAWKASTQVAFDTVDGSETSVPEGAHVGKITLSGSVPAALRQTMSVAAPPGSYHFSAWVMRASLSTEVEAEIDEGPTTPFIQFSRRDPVGRWTQIEGDFTILRSTYFEFMFGAQGSAGDVIYVDDVQLVGAEPVTPEPLDTQTSEPTLTPLPDTTSTRTPAATKTAAPTKTPRATNTPTFAPAPISATLANAGFEAADEDGLLNSWKKYGGTLHRIDAPVRSGGHAAQLESASASTKWLFQNVLVDGGASYEFGAWIEDDDPGVAAAFLRVSWYSSEDASGSALDAADSTERLTSPLAEYRRLTTGSIIAPAEAHSARLRIMLAPVSAARAAISADDASFGPAAPADPEDAAAGSGSQDAGIGANVDDAAPPIRRVPGESAKPRAARAVAAVNAQSASTASSARVVINEVMYDPDGAADPAAAEWVELYNAGDTPISLTNWSLMDAASAVTLPSVTIEPQGYVVIAASDSFRTNHPDFTGAIGVLGGRIGNSLGNDGDRLILRDATGATADAVSWGTDTSILKPAIVDAPSGHSIERRTAGADRDLASDFVDNQHPSPGGPFVANAAQQAPKAHSSQPQTLASGQRSLNWLIWVVSGLSASALAVAVAWRVAPALSQRLRRAT